MQDIRFDISDHVATITLHRPEQLNALTETMVDELIDALDGCEADDDVRVVVITGAGRGFCAGADLSQGDESFAEWLEDMQRLRDRTEEIWQTIVAQGLASGELRDLDPLFVKLILGALNYAVFGST